MVRGSTDKERNLSCSTDKERNLSCSTDKERRGEEAEV